MSFSLPSFVFCRVRGMSDLLITQVQINKKLLFLSDLYMSCEAMTYSFK